jgi:RNA ligase (TIGR02306 family)
VSTHKVEVVRLGPVEKHPNADTLGIVQIWAYTAIVRLGEYNEGDLVAYIEPDYCVPATEQFAFLKDNRIRAKRLRGIWSQGLVVRAPEGSQEGDNVMGVLGVTRYEPKVRTNRWGMPKRENEAAEVPHETLALVPKYDLENYRRYSSSMVHGEPVVVTEKLHGTNARFAWRDGRMWCGARSHWRKPTDDPRCDWWWGALAQNPWIEDWCRANEDAILFGEVFGAVQDLTYGAKEGEYRFRAFDVFRDGRFVDAERFAAQYITQGAEDACASMVPLLYVGPLPDLATLEEMSRRDSVFGGVSEGIVIKPLQERFDRSVGRVALKLVSDRYLERAK